MATVDVELRYKTHQEWSEGLARKFRETSQAFNNWSAYSAAMRLVSPTPEPRRVLPEAPLRPRYRGGLPTKAGRDSTTRNARRFSSISRCRSACTPPAAFQLGARSDAGLIPTSADLRPAENRQGAMRVDSFTTAAVDTSKLNELFQPDVSLVRT